jgi:hypothetical protein
MKRNGSKKVKQEKRKNDKEKRESPEKRGG